MEISQRIQQLRKRKGVSQEEFAEVTGVSRQAVSKWEGGQSLPDIDKIICMSEYFEVSTDFILKGVDAENTNGKKRGDLRIFVLCATVINFVAVVLACAMWYDSQTATAMIIGFIMLAAGCLVYGVGLMDCRPEQKVMVGGLFWQINIWWITFLPLSFMYNLLAFGTAAPYPLADGLTPQTSSFGFWTIYFVICLAVVALTVVRQLRSKKSIK